MLRLTSLLNFVFNSVLVEESGVKPSLRPNVSIFVYIQLLVVAPCRGNMLCYGIVAGYCNKATCLLTVTANEKPSSLPLNASNPLAAMISGGKDLRAAQQVLLAQAMTQKVICYLQFSVVFCLFQPLHDRLSIDY